MDPASALGPQLEEALRRMRARGIPGRSRSYLFGARFAARLAERGGRALAARFAADLLKCDDEPPDMEPGLKEAAVREWGGKSGERLDLDAFRLGFYVEMLNSAAREWEERAETALGGEPPETPAAGARLRRESRGADK
ncbi:MAG: hypothetical protein QXO51_05545 [Halobacteria archaeon]